MMRAFLVQAALIAVILPGTLAPGAERRMEHLTRGVVAMHQGDGRVYVGWRMLGTDPDEIAFNVYRTTGDEAPVRLNPEPITASTNFVDNQVDLMKPNAYSVRPVLDAEVNDLPDKYRRAFVLCYLEGKTNAEAAAELGCSQGTIFSRLAWARERLGNRLRRR